ncbi:hypothetical protein HW532_16020 [Kaustia mangrovi]|uniref:SMP-30/Gluconolactonase/LRE-like region domain-containing protein n=1 Tax=Kaustia mangrovi TaxID=2593653 RepID=A0A7S8C623_9HYPH|nr:hypothetical protein [Kaustia mangrovi]QPC44065.1 hypothetical protein HW532_16020 [Kaustia mangrovi]
MQRIDPVVAVLAAATAAIVMVSPSVAAEPIHEGFSAPVGIATDDAGALYVSSWSGGRVERIAPDGTRTVFADGLASPAGVAVGEDGAVYIATYSGDTILRYEEAGSGDVVAEGLATPAGSPSAKTAGF